MHTVWITTHRYANLTAHLIFFATSEIGMRHCCILGCLFHFQSTCVVMASTHFAVQMQVKVRRRGSDTKYVAQVLSVGTECDIGMYLFLLQHTASISLSMHPCVAPNICQDLAGYSASTCTSLHTHCLYDMCMPSNTTGLRVCSFVHAACNAQS